MPTQNEVRLRHLLADPSLRNVICLRIAENQPLFELYDHFLSNEQAFQECTTFVQTLDQLDIQLPEQAEEALQRLDFQAHVRLVRTLREIVQDHDIEHVIPSILARGPYPLTAVRTTNPCQNCGYRGHWPIECPRWICPRCRGRAPGHLPEECTLEEEPLRRPRVRVRTHHRPTPYPSTSSNSTSSSSVPIPPPAARPSTPIQNGRVTDLARAQQLLNRGRWNYHCLARGVTIPLDRVPSQLWCHNDGKLRDAKGVEYVPGLDGQAYYQSEDREGF